MRISKLTISNFRSFGSNPVEIPFEKDITTLIGCNSTGKTAAMEALRKLFGSTQQERELTRQDFHIPGDELPENIKKINLFIEARFEIDEDGDNAIPEFFSQMAISSPDTRPYIRIRLEAQWNDSNLTIDGDIEQNLFFIQVPEGEEIGDEHRQRVPVHQRNKIRYVYIPAIRRPGDQIRFVSGTVLHQLLRRIEFDPKFRASFKSNLNTVNADFQKQKGFAPIQSSMSSHWKGFHKDKRYGETKITFGGDDVESILRKIDIEFSPTGVSKVYKVDDLGEGLRSLFYLTLICTLLDVERQMLSTADEEKVLVTILAVEEPENHIAPQLIGRIITSLTSLIQNEKKSDDKEPTHLPNIQILLSSHTPAIIKRIRPEAIRHFRLDPEKHQTIVSPIVLPKSTADAYKYVKEAVQNYPEIYFSRLVVIGEGDSEEVVFNRLARAYNRDFDDNMISMVPLGHRFVNHIWRLLRQIGVPCITLLDLDLEREGGGWGRIKYALNQFLERGVSKDKLLVLPDGSILPDEQLEKMHDWDPSDISNLEFWLERLKKGNVFFSAPLDLDFMLLSAFQAQYLAQKNRGPQIPNKVNASAAFQEKVKKAVCNTLKSKDAIGELYTEADRELMIWYDYLFLGKGKPITHLEALEGISDKELKEGLPETLKAVFGRIEKLLE
jgi:predicted ATP-dependent endonuclease of OLD family